MYSKSILRTMCIAICRSSLVIAPCWIGPLALAADNSPSASNENLAEIVVTAEKREERLQEVPVPVTVISTEDLLNSNHERLQDYYTTVPGLNLVSGDGASSLAIRGITTGGGSTGNPTVGVTIDDVPFGSSSGLLAFGGQIPDIDPSDLARVEVLRGPQGTLYGASSIGGLLKYVTVDPSTEGFSGRMQADVNSVYNGNGPGYVVRGAVNIPLTDTLAVRASVFTRRDAGYIDDPFIGRDGVNRADVNGGRVSLLWRPSADLSLKIGALLQDTRGFGSAYVGSSFDVNQTGLGDLQQDALRGTGAYQGTIRLFTANLQAKLGDLDLTSISGYGINEYRQITDSTAIYGALASSYFDVNGGGLANSQETKKFTQELRLSSPLGHTFEWLAGGFYTRENSPINQGVVAIDPATGTVVGSVYDIVFPSTFTEYALFADLTTHITDRFDVQLGGRESRNRQAYNESDIGPLVPVIFGVPSPYIAPTLHSEDDAFTYLVTPRFEFSHDLMAYARFASGYRPGGPNPDSQIANLPSSYKSDRTYNYELGVKGDALNHLLSFDASVYYIDWKGIQIPVTDPASGYVFYTNSSSAKSQGIELAGSVVPMTGLTIGGWIALSDAKLTSNLPATAAIGYAGERLPYSSRFSGNLSIADEFPIAQGWKGNAGVDLSYVGDRSSGFDANAEQMLPTLMGYWRTNLHAGVRHDSWSANLYMNNVADKRGATGIDETSPTTFAYEYIQPRIIGLSVTKNF
jgi:iron complex outermembrane recepter protein